MNMLRMSPEQLAAHNERLKGARTIRFAGNETDQEIAQKGKQPKRAPKPKLFHEPEADVLRGCQRILDSHPKIAFWWRVNTGAMKMDNGRFVKFGFVGASDLMAVSFTGRFIAVECKSTGKRPTDDQRAFLDNVTNAGGLAVCVDHPGKLALALRAL